MKTKKCAFTGHRPQSLPFGFNEADERCIALKQKLRDEIIRQIEENGVTHFITGMAIGVDMFAAEIVLGLKSAYNGITLECAIPCETQAEKWSEALRDRLNIPLRRSRLSGKMETTCPDRRKPL